MKIERENARLYSIGTDSYPQNHFLSDLFFMTNTTSHYYTWFCSQQMDTNARLCLVLVLVMGFWSLVQKIYTRPGPLVLEFSNVLSQ